MEIIVQNIFFSILIAFLLVVCVLLAFNKEKMLNKLGTVIIFFTVLSGMSGIIYLMVTH